MSPLGKRTGPAPSRPNARRTPVGRGRGKAVRPTRRATGVCQPYTPRRPPAASGATRGAHAIRASPVRGAAVRQRAGVGGDPVSHGTPRRCGGAGRRQVYHVEGASGQVDWEGICLPMGADGCNQGRALGLAGGALAEVGEKPGRDSFRLGLQLVEGLARLVGHKRRGVVVDKRFRLLLGLTAARKRADPVCAASCLSTVPGRTATRRASRPGVRPVGAALPRTRSGLAGPREPSSRTIAAYLSDGSFGGSRL
jgi:hypothetical protein